MMHSNLRLSSGASPWNLTAADRMLLKRVALGEVDAVGPLVDRYADSLYSATDSFHLTTKQADEVAEEVIRRLAFEAPRFVARPERISEWFQRTLKDCLAAVVLRRNALPLDSRKMSVAASTFSGFLQNGSLASALAYLNGQTPFRFTAIYRIDGLSISNLYLFDREHELGREEYVSPVADTFCVWIHETLSVVQMTDSLRDPRAANHPRREQVRSYCGGPIKGVFGQLLGTICHFDVQPHEGLADTMPVLAEIGPLLASLIDGSETLPAPTRQLQRTWMIEVGQPAPEFDLETDEGTQVSLASLRGRKIVLFFYPKDNTSGWTREACDFRDALPRFGELDAIVFGISPDSAKSHSKFRAKYALPYNLLVDEGHMLADAYGIWKEKKLYGVTYMGVERTTVIIDESGRIARIFPKVQVEGHALAVADAISALG